jgi:AraC-like DNA-binding protein
MTTEDETYRIIDPPKSLARMVQFFWLSGPTRERCEGVPDGCVDVALILSPTDPQIQIYGTLTGRTEYSVVPGCPYFGFRLMPGCARALLKEDVDRFTDRAVVIDRFLGRTAAELYEAFQRGHGFEFFIQLLETASVAMPELLVHEAVRKIHQSYGKIRIQALASEIGTSYRTLERAFRREIGIPPKFYGRIQRLDAFIRRLRLRRNDWSEIAFDLGYSDQAHLIRDVVQLTDYTPTDLARLTAAQESVGFTAKRLQNLAQGEGLAEPWVCYFRTRRSEGAPEIESPIAEDRGRF